MTYGFKSRLAHQNGASDKACSVFFICFFGRRDVSVPPGLGPKCPRCRWASASFCRFAAALARGSRAFLSAKQAEFGSSGVFQIPPVFLCGKCGFCGKTRASSTFKAARGFPPRLYPALPWASPSGFCPARRRGRSCARRPSWFCRTVSFPARRRTPEWRSAPGPKAG